MHGTNEHPAAASVLVVDDDPRWLRAVRRWLHTLGVERIYCAQNVEEAFEHLDVALRCVVLTDMRMHGNPRAGLLVVSRARRIGAPVAVLTGSSHVVGWSELADVPTIDKHALTRELLYDLLVQLKRELIARRGGVRPERPF